MLLKLFKNEFKKENLFYDHRNERIFYCSQWRYPHSVYVAIRSLLAIYTIVGLCHQVYDYIDATSSPSNNVETQRNETDDDEVDFDEYKLLVVYMTVWSYILLVLHMSLQALLCIIFYRRATEYLRYVMETGNSVKPATITFTAEGPRGRSAPSTANKSQLEVERKSNPVFTNDQGDQVIQQNYPVTENKFPHSQTMSSNGEKVHLESSLVTRKSPPMNANPGEATVVISPQANTSHSMFQDKKLASVTTAWYFKLSWVVSDIVTTVAPLVTIIFFVVLYPTMDMGKEGRLDLVNVNVHLLNAVFILIDFAISARPVKLLHVIATIAYGLVYVIFSVMYWAGDHKRNVIYPVLDWNTPGSAIIFVLGLLFVGLPLIKLVFFALDQLKTYLHKRWYGCTFDEGFHAVY